MNSIFFNYKTQSVKITVTTLYISAHLLPTMSSVNRLSRNALVSLGNDVVTNEKIEMNIRINPNTVFLTTSNKTGDTINKMALDKRFTNQPLLGDVLDRNKQPMQLYENITVVVTENR